MPDTPKTVRELLSPRWPLVPDDVERRDTWREAWDQLQQSGILNALIGAQGRVVYTEEDVEAMGKAISQELGMMVQRGIPEAEGFPLIARAAITAAGGVVADKVRTFAMHEKATLKVTKPREVVRIPLGVHPDDKLYIVRAKEE